MPQRQTAHVPSHVPVGQPLYIFDMGTHKFDGTLYRSRAHTHTHHPSFRFYGHLKPVIPPLSSRGSPPLYICYIQDSISHTLHMLHFLIDPTPTLPKTLMNPHTILSLYVCISLTQPHVGGVRTQEENRCTMHVLTLRAQPHPRGYTVELISLRKWQPTC